MVDKIDFDDCPRGDIYEHDIRLLREEAAQNRDEHARIHSKLDDVIRTTSNINGRIGVILTLLIGLILAIVGTFLKGLK